jgi:hypothetical protein
MMKVEEWQRDQVEEGPSTRSGSGDRRGSADVRRSRPPAGLMGVPFEPDAQKQRQRRAPN